jgi:hypothetical protein
MRWDAKAVERGVKLIAGRVSVSGGTPAIVDGDGFSIADTAAGKVTITLSDPGKAILAALATSTEATDATAHSVKMEVVSESSVVARIYVHDGTDGALADNVGFSFLIVAKDTRL